MRTFKDLYYVISYALLTVQIGFASIWLYNKMIYHRTLYYGDPDKPLSVISLNYFYILKFQLYATFALMIVWALLTPLAVISNKGSIEKDYVPVVVGAIGFVSAVSIVIIDPFGIFKWFTH
jgi:hypothetical protein